MCNLLLTFIHYNKKPISLREALDHPEATNDKLDELNSELKKNPYKYNDDWLDSVDEINDAF